MNTDTRSGPAPLHRFAEAAYRGYGVQRSARPDEELTRVGPGVPCGEYLRRFWHPVALSSDLADLPVALRILGEDLVVFRDGEGRIGLVHRRCPHRQASLEYGTCRQRGIRCCYHGWRFDVDGTLLEAPGQPPEAEARLKRRIRLGAYPAFEYRGLVFAYLGPPEEMPEFPVYDTFELPDMEMVPYRAPFRCNWLQVLDAILDPVHTSFLHSGISREQFSAGFGEVGRLDFFDRNAWLMGTNTRRVGGNVWFRVNELVLPNFTQAGAAFATDGTRQRYYGRSAFVRWVVPVDDENTMALAWACFGERGRSAGVEHPRGTGAHRAGRGLRPPLRAAPALPGRCRSGRGHGPHHRARQRAPGSQRQGGRTHAPAAPRAGESGRGRASVPCGSPTSRRTRFRPAAATRCSRSRHPRRRVRTSRSASAGSPTPSCRCSSTPADCRSPTGSRS